MANSRGIAWPALDMSAEDHKELAIYESQERLVLETQRRKDAFEQRMEKMRAEFLAEEKQLVEERANIFFCRLKIQGSLENLRADMVPAYTFTLFPLLPKEIQLRIWSMAARLEAPQDYFVLPTMRRNPNGSTIAFKKISGTGRRDDHTTLYPNLLAVVQDSRHVALQVYQLVLFRILEAPFIDQQHLTYVNTLYSQFYMVEGWWVAFRVLANIFHRTNGGTLGSTAQENLMFYANIRFLTIDIGVFAQAPAIVWNHFEELKVLTVGFYPTTEFPFVQDGGTRMTDIMDNFKLEQPSPNTYFAWRATWLEKVVLRSLAQAKDTTSNRKLPRVKVAVIKVRDGTGTDAFVDSSFHETSETLEMIDFGTDVNSDELYHRYRIPGQDRLWYVGVVAKMEKEAQMTSDGLHNWDGGNVDTDSDD